MILENLDSGKLKPGNAFTMGFGSRQAPDPAVRQWGKSSFSDLKSFRAGG